MSQAGRELLRALKATAGADASCLGLKVGNPFAAWLRPVATAADRIQATDVRLLTEWRNRHVGAFLHEFLADEARTTRWLSDLVGPDDSRILFMLDDPAGRTFAYMGLAFIDWEAGSFEADAVVRGMAAAPGTMTEALRTLIRWAQMQLGLPRAGVRVRSDNPALCFYEKMGFLEKERRPLRKTSEPDGVKWVEQDAPAGAPIHLVMMDYPSI